MRGLNKKHRIAQFPMFLSTIRCETTGKFILGILLTFWIRAPLPRLRIDQLMALAWKVIIPISFGNFILVAVVVFVGDRFNLPIIQTQLVLGSISLISMISLAYLLTSRRKRRLAVYRERWGER